MQLIAPESAEQIKAAYARHARGEEVEPYEYTLVTKDGRRVESLITTRLIDYEGSKAILGIVTDITERKAGERALRESEESFRALAENASDGVTIGDEHGRHAFANRRAAEMLGYSVEQLLEMTFREFLPPGDRQMIEERFARRLRGEDVPSHHEMAVTRRDGSVAPVEVGVSQTRWHGRPAVMVVLRDVAERKRAEQALAASEERYRNLVESSPDGIAVYQDGVVVLANRASAVLLGYSDGAELVGRTAARPRALSRPKTGRGSRNAPSCSAPAARPPALCW
jgi:PAS domain S-box-containing protein